MNHKRPLYAENIFFSLCFTAVFAYATVFFAGSLAACRDFESPRNGASSPLYTDNRPGEFRADDARNGPAADYPFSGETLVASR